MRIGIDARMLSPAYGLGRYVEQLVKHLEKVDSENEYVIFLRRENWDAFTPTSPNFKKVLANIHWYTIEEQIALTRIIKKEKVDLMHFTHFNVPLVYTGPFVVTIHDLIMYRFPRPEATTHGRILFQIKDIAHRLVIRNAVRKAKHIITTSEYTKYDITDILGVDKIKISVTYQAPFEIVVPFNAVVQKSYRSYGITKPFILYVGAAYPHKNLQTLLRAWVEFQQQYSTDYQLVLVGSHDYFYKQLISQAHTIGITDVIFTGFVPDEELLDLYQNAYLYVFPSLYEGFGLPPLEAMSRGTPVVSSNASCLPEVLGDAAIYFDPKSPSNIAEVIYEVLENKDTQMMLLQNARMLLGRYSWKKMAEETVRIYSQNV